MKKRFLPILLLAALAASGCEGLNLGSGSARDVTVGIIITELIDTRTGIADNLLSIKWSADDCIGVASKTDVNTCFSLNPESVGQRDGIFTGTITGNVESAYYPYSISAGNDPTVAELAMLVTREGEIGVPDMKYNFMVANHAEGSARKGFSMTMVPKTALLNLVITPNDFLHGGHMKSLRIIVPQRELAGRFKMDLTDLAAPLSAVNSADSVVINYAAMYTMIGTISVPFFVNPAIAAGDSLHITLGTTKGPVYIDIKADKALEAGKKMDIQLNIRDLVEAGKAVIPADVPDSPGFLSTLTTPGVYDISNHESIVPIFTYTPGSDQYALYSSGQYSYYRILNFQTGKMIYISTPKDVVAGASVSLKTENVGLPQVPAFTGQVTCVAVNSNMGWFFDSVNHLGYIVAR